MSVNKTYWYLYKSNFIARNYLEGNQKCTLVFSNTESDSFFKIWNPGPFWKNWSSFQWSFCMLVICTCTSDIESHLMSIFIEMWITSLNLRPNSKCVIKPKWIKHFTMCTSCFLSELSAWNGTLFHVRFVNVTML